MKKNPEYFLITNEDLEKEIYLRLDFHFWSWKRSHEDSPNEPKLRHRIKRLSNGHAIKMEDYANVETNYIHLVPRNIKDGEFNEENVIFLTDDKGEALEKCAVKSRNLLMVISSNCGNTLHFEPKTIPANLARKQFTLSHYMIEIEPKSSMKPKALAYYLNAIKDYFRAIETGKTQKNLPLYYVRNIPLSEKFLSNQGEIVTRVLPIDKEIAQIKLKRKERRDISEEAIRKKYDYDLCKLNNKSQSFFLGFSELSRSHQLRMSINFNDPNHKYLTEVLEKHKVIKLKKLLIEPTILGKSPKYSEDGHALYIGSNALRNWKLDLEGVKTLDVDFYSKAKKRYSLEKWDILMARSGEGTIGKVGLFEYNGAEHPAIFSDFVMRIRVNTEKIRPRFLYYYMMSSLFQSIVETEKKGMGNMTNIFPSQVETFPIIYPSLDIQKEIEKEIEHRIKEQKIFSQEITNKKLEIETILKEFH